MWTRLLLAGVLLGCVSGSASAQEPDGWSRRDWTLQAVYTTLHVMDWSQSLAIARDPERLERNPILGERPSPARVHGYFAGTLAAHWAVSALLPPKARGVWQCFTIVLEGKSVTRNFAVGVKLAVP